MISLEFFYRYCSSSCVSCDFYPFFMWILALWLHISIYLSPCLFPSQHQEFSFLLKERVCPLVIKLFSPNIKFRQGSSSASSPAPVEKPYFPICMRLLRVVSVLIKHFYSLLVLEQWSKGFSPASCWDAFAYPVWSELKEGPPPYLNLLQLF